MIGLHAGTAVELAQRETQVNIQVARLQKAVVALGEAVGSVTGRLSGVLRNEPPSQIHGSKTETPHTPLVSLASSIESEVDTLEAMARELRDVQERLEL